jgi:hypothetical protein
MFIGHFGVALATKKVAPRPSLGTLVIAALLPDLLWSAFLLLRWERVAIVPGATVVSPLDFVSYPLSHSRVADTIWAAIVLSHWALDVVSHRPDVPILLGGPKVGLGLWNALPAALAAELGLLAVGTWVYAKATGARDRMGTGSLVALVALLTALYFASLVGPPPPSTEALAASGLAQWLFVAWAYWLDRHRAPRGQ